MLFSFFFFLDHTFISIHSGEHSGYFHNGKKHGLGVRVFENNSWYFATWEQDQLANRSVPVQPGPSSPNVKLVKI